MIGETQGTTQGTTNTTTYTSSVKETQERFLTLLVTQLKNQDPLNPMDNAQMTSQLAQMEMVEGVERVNTTLNSLIEDLSVSQSMQAAALIGKNVLVEGSGLVLQEGFAFGGVSLPEAADSVTVHIFDASGAEVQKEVLGAKAAGTFNFAWDGTVGEGEQLADGKYTFTVEATSGGRSVAATPLQLGMVSALVRSGNSFLLDLGPLGSVDYKSVLQVI
ncbi:MAG: flagellar hook assembly protein FlgD [Candidatus Accumulibacter sp.]|jgi:flagellar basal-body rod modification protein FlgD|nr:flagellar hook assembly protein FlgD [Accumulibacter sp.]